MNSNTTRRSRLVPLAALATVVAIAASASAAAVNSNDDQPQVSEVTTSKATVKSLSKLVKRLTKRIVALEQKNTPNSLPPSGPAKGDLAGNYPNPTLANNVVGPAKIPDQSLTGSEIATGTLFADDLAPDSVGGSELKGAHVVVSNGVTIPEGQAVDAYVDCPSGEQLLSGGYTFSNFRGDTRGSAPSLTHPNRWEATGDNTYYDDTVAMYVWALCLQV